MTTAQMREKARGYEAALDWANAAACWREAIRLYPAKPFPGSLAAADITKMMRHAESCEYMAKTHAA